MWILTVEGKENDGAYAVENEDGEIRFKSEDTKGKKPTLFTSKDDFDQFVTVMQSYVPKIMAKLEALRSRQ